MHMLHTCKNGLKLTCLVPGVVRAWTWCPAGITLGSALKYPIYYFDELPKRMLHWHTRSTENSLLPLVPDPQYFHRSHSFTMKFGADNNGSHLPFSRQRNVADSALSVWTSVYRVMFIKGCQILLWYTPIRCQTNEWIHWNTCMSSIPNSVHFVEWM